jgi:class 3 adenylate cyclase/tetratricopeptide (TPR) repeat protein
VRPTEERRRVTILFADLVGFTERSDRADPEDVRTTLLPFHARVKQDIERYGGTLDKFIGDAVMGVFGAPVAHEDDALRAVRAALRVLRTIEELRASDPDLRVRVAINTGEAVVALGEGPQIGEAVAGDVVNTASRMQALAPPGGVVIGEETYRQVRDRIDAERLPPAIVKGKSEPIVVWRVLGEHDPSTTARVTTTRFVGRDAELSVLSEVFERTVATRTPHVVTITGEAGIGKSRLVDELRLAVGSRADWLEGACLPYGESVTLAAVADVVRAAAGIPPAASADDAAAAVRAAFETAGRTPLEASGFAARLAPAIGVSDVEESESVTSAELGSAVGALVATRERPVLVAVHDLHWADDLVLEVLTAALGVVRDRAVLLVSTARPEFHDRGVRWPPPAFDATTLRLSPLSADQTEALVLSMITDIALGADARASLLERAGGNPLFALEYIRMLADDARESAAVPETIRALIAARIDAIPAPERARLQAAAVAGSEFWPELLAALGDEDAADVDDALTSLVRRGLVRPSASTLDGRAAFAFTHDLIREVAYERIPRVDRARRHLATGSWLEAAAGERPGERAELLAQHFGAAVDVASAARAEDIVERARPSAVRWLTEAGRRAIAADPRGAFATLERAAALTTPGSSGEADALAASALAGRRSGLLTPEEILDRYRRAASIRRRLGEGASLGDVLIRMSSQLAIVGRPSEAREALAEAIELLEGGPPERLLAGAYAYRAEAALFAGDPDEAMRDAGRTLDILGEESIDEFAVMALHLRGDARCSLGDRAGLDDLERALEISAATQRASDVVTSESYLADWTLAFRGPSESWPHYRRSIETAERAGVLSQGLWSKAGALFSLYELGRDDDVLRMADDILRLGKDRLDATVWVFANVVRAEVLLDAGRPEDAIDADELLEHARAAEDVQAVAPSLISAGRLRAEVGDRAGAGRALEEFEAVTREVAPEYREAILARAARLAVALTHEDVLRRLVQASLGRLPHHAHNLASARAALLELQGRPAAAREAYREAADGWTAFGSVREATFARAGAERCADAG